MNTFPLKLVFNDISKNNIIIDLEEDNFIHTTIPPEINKFNLEDKYLAYIYSKTDIKDVMNNLLEEGSSSITYSYLLQPVIKDDIFRKLLHSFFLKHNFYVKFLKISSNPSKKNKITGDFDIVITERDINHTFIQNWISNLLESDSDSDEVNRLTIISDEPDNNINNENSNIETETDDDDDTLEDTTDEDDEEIKETDEEETKETDDEETDEEETKETDDEETDDEETGEEETKEMDEEDIKTEDETEETDEEDIKTEDETEDEE